MRTKIMSLACAFLSAVVMAWSYFRFGYLFIMLGILIVPIIWAVNLRLGVQWIPSSLLFVICIVSSVGLFLDMPVLWMLLSWLVSFIAWDLNHFSYRMERAQSVDGADQIERHHILWVLSALSLGFLVAVITLNIKVALNFWVIVVLSILLVWGIGQGIRMVKASRL